MFLGIIKETSKDKKWYIGSKESAAGKGKAIQSVNLWSVKPEILGSIPSGVTNSATERNSYGLGYHNRQLDSRNQSFPICNRN